MKRASTSLMTTGIHNVRASNAPPVVVTPRRAHGWKGQKTSLNLSLTSATGISSCTLARGSA